ncbi:MAG: type II secretion system protein [Candidatus Eisenbacteria bacterium]|uniref:Type II secretion system protein n=1 Tax=Eiseniibacteriota bacterium TaxID=2212470 RepID=A0A933S9J3_UNCEI|nr:type II secretion system protein [Candidatus Eisenbacteria bacterium]
MNLRSQRGFTIIELLIVLSILSILVRVSLPAYKGIQRDAIATQALGDFNTVRAAAVAQYEATGAYAADGPAGIVPAGMAPFLPRQYSFTKESYTLDWENFTVADSTMGPGQSGSVLALTITASDSLVGRQILHMVGANCAHWSIDNAHTFVVLSTLEAPR